jgi:hypothetical protein
MSEKILFEDPAQYSINNPIHWACYSYNGIGKTTLAGTSGLRTIVLDCGDSGAVTLRKVESKLLKIVRIRSILHYLDTIEVCIRMAKEDKLDLLVPDTMTGLQSLAIREVKGVKKFDMNQRKWGLVSSKIIECIAETRNFPKDVLYLVQERKKSQEEGNDSIMPALTPSIRGALSSNVDWVGRLEIDSDGNRTLNFKIEEGLEVKDRAGIFPKLLKLRPAPAPNYMAIRNRIVKTLHEGA